MISYQTRRHPSSQLKFSAIDSHNRAIGSPCIPAMISSITSSSSGIDAGVARVLEEGRNEQDPSDKAMSLPLDGAQQEYMVRIRRRNILRH